MNNIQKTRNLGVIVKIKHLKNDKLVNDSSNCDTEFYIKTSVCPFSIGIPPDRCIAYRKVVSGLFLHKLIRKVQRIIVVRFFIQA